MMRVLMQLIEGDENDYVSDRKWWEWSWSHPSAAKVSKTDRRGVSDQYVGVGGHLIVVDYHEDGDDYCEDDDDYCDDDDDYCEDDDEQKPGLEKPPVATFSDNPPPWEGWKPTHWTQVARAFLIDQAWLM